MEEERCRWGRRRLGWEAAVEPIRGKKMLSRKECAEKHRTEVTGSVGRCCRQQQQPHDAESAGHESELSVLSEHELRLQ